MKENELPNFLFFPNRKYFVQPKCFNMNVQVCVMKGIQCVFNVHNSKSEQTLFQIIFIVNDELILWEENHDDHYRGIHSFIKKNLSWLFQISSCVHVHSNSMS